MSRRTRFSVFGFALTSALAFNAPPTLAAGGATAFLPHQALYELSLRKARGSAAVESARGRILYNFSGSACEGYTSDFRQVSELDGGDGKMTMSDLRSTSWEDAAGKSYRFKIETRMNDADPSPIDGVAERTGNGITVKLKKPSAKTLTLSGDTVFPTEHIHRIIVAAQEGKSLLELPVYDGSDTGEKVYSTLTVIGPAVPEDRAVATPDPAITNDGLKKLKRWPVTVSYFDSDAKKAEGEQTPVYAMSFELYENGVSRALVLDYNDFVIAGAMTKLDVKEAKPCK
jgi:hypothetical protein